MKNLKECGILKEILRVFTKEYIQECEYYEQSLFYLPSFKLKSTGVENIDNNINLLESENFVSNFKLKLTDY